MNLLTSSSSSARSIVSVPPIEAGASFNPSFSMPDLINRRYILKANT
ncbi:MAG: hypothetical protein HY096_08285 [Nitrospinae bacterium]|nr:hypothetical protein [Nitrospinota bacterium]